MQKTIFILGRQPALGIAELESLYGADYIKPIKAGAALVNHNDGALQFNRLGGSMKACRYITSLPHTNWNNISDYLLGAVPQLALDLPEGKIRLGLSAYGLDINPKRLNATGLCIKKAIKSSGRSVRVVPNVHNDLNTAQLIHNQLTGPTGIELIAIRDGTETILAQTFAVQDIEAYTARDQKRPMRDARVGMLPPKLAQIILNLATGDATLSPLHDNQLVVLDPFCGTGVMLQEALLDGYHVMGSDLEQRMVEYSQKNIQWLKDTVGYEGEVLSVETGDATNHTWGNSAKINAVACETYLGRPFSSAPSESVLRDVIQDVNLIHKKFLRNLGPQLHSGARLCLAVPAWHINKHFKHLPVLDQLSELGYTRTSFVHVPTSDLVYHRPGQVVARELVVLQRT